VREPGWLNRGDNNHLSQAWTVELVSSMNKMHLKESRTSRAITLWIISRARLELTIRTFYCITRALAQVCVFHVVAVKAAPPGMVGIPLLAGVPEVMPTVVVPPLVVVLPTPGLNGVEVSLLPTVVTGVVPGVDTVVVPLVYPNHPLLLSSIPEALGLARVALPVPLLAGCYPARECYWTAAWPVLLG